MSESLIVVGALGLLTLLWLTQRLRARLTAATYELARQRRAVQELRQQIASLQSQRRALGAVATCGLVMLDAERRLLWFNDDAQEVMRSDAAAGHLLIEMLPSYEISQTVDDAWERHALVERQVPFKSKLWQVRAWDIEQEGIVLALNDVSELQRLGRARREFVANISHDLRTPIAAVQLSLETLRGGALDDPVMSRRLLDNMTTQADALQQLAAELFDLSQIESGQVLLKLTPVAAAALVEPVVERLRPQAERKALQIEIALDAPEPALADTEQMRKVVVNLLHNAIKFSPAGKRAGIMAWPIACQNGTLSAGAQRALPPPPAGFADGQWIAFMVWDEGPGIPSSELPRIFERFYKGDRARARSGETGAGLGLSIARHIVLGHGGQIWAESAPGQGARFFFTLPIA